MGESLELSDSVVPPSPYITFKYRWRMRHSSVLIIIIWKFSVDRNVMWNSDWVFFLSASRFFYFSISHEEGAISSSFRLPFHRVKTESSGELCVGTDGKGESNQSNFGCRSSCFISVLSSLRRSSLSWLNFKSWNFFEWKLGGLLI